MTLDVDGFVAYPDHCDVASLNSDGDVKCTTCEERYTLSTAGDSCMSKYKKYTNKYKPCVPINKQPNKHASYKEK